MTDTRKEQRTTHYRHSLHVLERRRSLFPSEVDSEEDSDLGHISPLHFDSDSEEFQCLQDENMLLLSKTDSIEDYDILEVVENIQGSICTPLNIKNYACSETMSSLYVSPCVKLNDNSIITETPSKISPLYKLKTPHDACNTNSKIPKLTRKSLLDSSDNSVNKRQASPYNSPDESSSKHVKLDPKNSKVRTTLFPEVDITLPTKSFYPKTEDIMEKIQSKNNTYSKPPILQTSSTSNRKVRPRKRPGQINAGVCHKIRKPKHKTSSVRAAVTTINNTAITEYIKDLTQVSNGQKSLIENKENAEPKSATGLIEHKFKPSKLPETNGYTYKFTPIDSNNKKRPLSPPLEPDPKRKFFKFSRGKGVVTMNKNIKVQVDHGKMTLIEKVKKQQLPTINFDSSDLTVEDSPNVPNIDNILSSLENENSSKIVLQAHNSVAASENSILLHSEPKRSAANLILSPISQMCDVTSGLALNSPKKVKNLTSVLNEISSVNASSIYCKQDSSDVIKQKLLLLSDGITSDVNSSHNSSEALTDVTKQKLFPVFYNKTTVSPIPEKKEGKGLSRTAKKFKNLEDSQMLLDAGQKKFGFTQCSECSIVYHIGDPSDENMHLTYHNAGHVLRFAGWKNEKVVCDFQNNGRIIHILPGDSKIWWKKIKDLMEVINRELGCYEMEFSLDHSQIFLYIKNRTIVGCAVAVPKSEGHRMLTTKENEADLCSEETYPIKCGISRIWVSHNYRKQGVGSALMNAVKKNFMFGYILNDNDIALSPPTEMGKMFAESYFKTRNYFIYYV